MLKALVIGCGNIGALYDMNNDAILSHAKALHLDPRFSLSIYDINEGLAKKVAAKYSCEVVQKINTEILSTFDCVSICTPTETHFNYLLSAMDAGVKVIVCEKPVSNKEDELSEIQSAYRNASSKVLVNYVRRFQPAYNELKNVLAEMMKTEVLTNISIRYQRGFINNCSHAFDIIEYLTGSVIELDEIKKHNEVNDHFVYDPTLSLQAMWKQANINVLGLTHVKFSLFEIDLCFECHKINIRDAGQTIQLYKADENYSFLQPLKILQFTREHCLADYMKPVIDHVHKLLTCEAQHDNFLHSLNLNQRMLTYLNN